PSPAGARRRASHLVRTACCGVAHYLADMRPIPSPGAAPASPSPWQNRPMRLRLFALLLGVPLLLTGGLVLALRGGKSAVRNQVSTGAGSGTSTDEKPARDSRGVRLVRIGTFSSPLYVTSP